jgi:hypothetical protein
MGLLAAVALAVAACNQVTNGEPGEEGSDPAASILNLGKQGVGANPANWNVITNPPFVGLKLGISTINGVTSNAGTIVAVAGTASATYASTSTNGGNSWTDQSPPLAPTVLIRDPSVVNYLGPNPNGNYLVTAGNRVSAGAFSSDGTNWSATGYIGFGTKASAYGPDTNNALVYVVGGQGGQAAYTTNLASAFTLIPPSVTGWTASGGAAYINAGAYGQGSSPETTPLFVFGGGSARIAYTDTIPADLTGQWGTANQTAFTGSDFINVIVFGDGTFVAVGGPGAGAGNHGKAAYSTDGINWTATANFPLGNTVDVYALAFGYGPQGQACFVAGDDAGYIAYSYTGGVTWTLANPQPVLNGKVNAITYATYGSTSRFIAVGGSTPGVAYTLP